VLGEINDGVQEGGTFRGLNGQKNPQSRRLAKNKEGSGFSNAEE